MKHSGKADRAGDYYQVLIFIDRGREQLHSIGAVKCRGDGVAGAG